MITIKNLTIKNFLSIGNTTQAINFDRKDLTLVLGENIDLGGDDAGARNGVGKTCVINALSYALFGQALTNIKKDNLINRTNGKNMLVTIEFIKDGVTYRIERGRKPGVLAFYQGDVAFEAKDNDAQGDSRETQGAIERVINIPHEMFCHTVALNTYTSPFLSLRANDQRTIIEQLLGVTVLSERADKLKEAIRMSKETVTSEEHRIKAITEANKKIEEQVAAIKRKQKIWDDKKESDIAEITSDLESMLTIDITAEITAHKKLDEWVVADTARSKVITALKQVDRDIEAVEKSIKQVCADIDTLKSHTCHACGQELHNNRQQAMLAEKEALLVEHTAALTELTASQTKLSDELDTFGAMPAKPTTHYKKSSDAYNHKNSIDKLTSQLESRMADENPYTDQIAEMENAALTPIDYTVIDNANKAKDHQEFLLKLLTNKDSFIRKRIIDQNLSYLNARLSQYLDKIGLPHTVVFQNDLSVNIEEFGRDLDFDNLSRGERGRLILSMDFAFRDVWESLYEPINLLFIDEMIDNGLDASGVESAMSILKRMGRDTNKSVWLVSHRDELASRVSNILKVVKEGGFTSFMANEDELA